jgi:hypothetical protein
MRNGDKVVYVGPENDEVSYGVHGQVLSCTAAYAHVQWQEGNVTGKVGLYMAEDLNVASDIRNAVTASLDDSLEVGSLTSLSSAREAYEETGGQGLVSHLASVGYLAGYSQVAEEALQLITAQLQQDPVLHQLTASMDPEEADEVFRTAAHMLLSDSGDF